MASSTSCHCARAIIMASALQSQPIMRLSIFEDNLGRNCHYFFKKEPIFTTLPRSRLFTFLRPMSRVACDGVSSKCKHRKPMIFPSPRQTSTASDPAEFVFYGRGQKSRRGRRCISINRKNTGPTKKKTRQRVVQLLPPK